MLYSFDDYTLDAEHYELRQAGRLLPIEPRVLDVLAYLVQHPGRTVTTEELKEHLYPHQVGTDDRLTNAVAQARKALARLLPFCPVEGCQKSRACLIAAPVS
jgi:DNA-binding winged helix-turn-helix (wHTH) protein